MSQRVKRDSVPYDVWVKQGLLKTTEGNVVDYAFIEKFIDELSTRYNIREVAYDRWGATQMSQNLERLGLVVVPFGQNTSVYYRLATCNNPHYIKVYWHSRFNIV